MSSKVPGESSKDKESDDKSDSKKLEETKPTSPSTSKPDLPVEAIRVYLAEKLGFSDVIDSKTPKEKSKNLHKQILETVDFDGVIKHWKNDGFKNIVLMVGAGISTSAGIPDFRSPETGLYNNLQKYKLPYPTAIFELDYFERNPQPFYSLAKELYPGTFKPTPCHYFIKLLNEKGILQRLYTQNIDTLERIAGIDDEKMVEAHGSFHTNHCIDCRKEYDMKWVKQKIFEDVIPTCDCNGVVKPDIVFFGENLPDKFYTCPDKDFRKCDLLIIMGTSLEVQPFASLTEKVHDKCVRLLINREIVGQSKRSMRHLLFGEGLCFDSPDNFRDVAWTGDCDDGVFLIADKLGWGDELREMIKREYAIIDGENKTDEKDKKEEDKKEDDNKDDDKKKDVDKE